MRVIAGTHRGRRLAAPPGLDTRPTSDRVRESLFSILGPLDGERVLDLFAGSGALGIEALSRGAGSALLCDDAQPAVDAIRANLEALGMDAQVVRDDARPGTAQRTRPWRRLRSDLPRPSIPPSGAMGSGPLRAGPRRPRTRRARHR